MDIIKETFDKVLHIDENGLHDLTDIKILKYLFSNYPQPVGLANMCQMVDEDSEHVATIMEPQLFKLGFIERSRSGRIITRKGIDYLKKNGYIEEADIASHIVALT
jgi:Holliday junction DNA helicase RuvB